MRLYALLAEGFRALVTGRFNLKSLVPGRLAVRNIRFTGASIVCFDISCCCGRFHCSIITLLLGVRICNRCRIGRGWFRRCFVAATLRHLSRN